MLVLSRKLREKIQIGDNVTLTILRVKGNSVRIGIEAPRSVKVVRGELPPEVEVTLPKESNDGSFDANRRTESSLTRSMTSEPASHANVSVFVSDPTDDRVIEFNNEGPIQVHEASSESSPAGKESDTKSVDGRMLGHQKRDSAVSQQSNGVEFRSMSDASKKSIHGADSLPSGQNRLRQIADAIAKLS